MKFKQPDIGASCTAFAPASVTNLSCGFDVLGLAMEYPGDEVRLTVATEKGVRIKNIMNNSGSIPLNPEENCAGFPVCRLYELYGLEYGIEISIVKHMGIGSGLGSSAASAVAAVTAFDALFKTDLSLTEKLEFAKMGEAIAAGDSVHIDNIAASMYGGIVLVRDADSLDIIPLDFPATLWCVVLYPRITLRTEEMRNILPETVPLRKAVIQWGNLAAFIAGLHQHDMSIVKKAMHDEIIEPVRKTYIPNFTEAKQIAEKKGAIGTAISGSGPSIASLAESKAHAQAIHDAWTDRFNADGKKGFIYSSVINRRGAYVKDMYAE